MSMLAGPKRKQKWTLNPRGKHWSEDSNKFGQKMLEKMGWSSGKGLGAKEQGSVEHVRVRVKNDQVGIGYNKDCDNQWTEHQDDFNSFLQNLQKEQSMDTADTTEESNKVLSGKSLEEKSKQSQKRVHYKKFTRGKDVNKYSTKDLANIFGKKDLNEKTANQEEIEDDEKVYDPVGAKDMTAGVLTIKGGNMNDYFKSKLYKGEENVTSQDRENSESETEKRAGFGFSVKSKSKFYLNQTESADKKVSDTESDKYLGFGFLKSTESKSKSKKLNSLNYVFDNPCLDLNILDDNSPVPRTYKTEIIESEKSDKITPRKRKKEFISENEKDGECIDRPTPKKRKSDFMFENKGLDLGFPDNPAIPKKEVSQFTYENEGLDLEYSNEPVLEKINNSEPVSNEYGNSVFELKTADKPTPKKSKKIKNESAVTGYENPGLDLEFPDKPTPKKSKKVKIEVIPNGYENPGLDLQFLDRPTPKKVKKEKVSGDSLTAYENPGLDLEFPDRPTPKKLKKGKACEDTLVAYENPGLNLEVPDRPTPKKIKTDKDSANSLNVYENAGMDLEFPDRPTPRKSKKKKETQDSPMEYENLGLDLELPNGPQERVENGKEFGVVTNAYENPGLDLQFPDKPTPKKTKKSKEPENSSNVYENPGLDLEFPDNPTPKKLKKPKENDIPADGFENPALDLNYPIQEVFSTTEFEVARTTCGVENSALNLSDEDLNKKRVTFNAQLEYNTDIVKKKKKKKKLDKYEVVTEKLKKKSKSVEPVAFVNEAVDMQTMNKEELDNELNERKSRKCKRRKERRVSLLETIPEAPEEEAPNDDEDIKVVGEFSCNGVEIMNDDLPKKSRAEKKNKKNAVQTMNEIESDDIIITEERIKEIDISEEPVEIVKKKKKKKKDIEIKSVEKMEIDVTIENPGKENISVDDGEIKNVEGKKKKKKKKSSDEDVISLEEFLNEENEKETRPKNDKQNFESEICVIESKTVEVVQKSEGDGVQNSFQTFRKSKQVMKSLFIKNPTLLFNGSNINEIKGYGSHMPNNYF